MEKSSNSPEGGFDPSSKNIGSGGTSWKAASRNMFGDDERIAAKKAFAKAGFSRQGSVYEDFISSSPNPKTRAEVKEAVDKAKQAAIDYYSDPEKLGELGDRIKVALTDYGHNSDESLTKEERGKIRASLKFSDDGEKAVHTKMMVDIYNGALLRLKKAADTSKDRSFLKTPEGGELEEAPTPEKLEQAYKKATSRDRSYIWTLETDRDGRTRAVKKKAPSFGDWTRDTVDGMAAGSNMEDGVGYLLGRSLRAMVRLLPGMGEVEGKEQLRAKTARLYQQMESLVPSRRGAIHPHSTPSQQQVAGDNREGSISGDGVEGTHSGGLKKGGTGGFRPSMSRQGMRRDKEARGAGMA